MQEEMPRLAGEDVDLHWHLYRMRNGKWIVQLGNKLFSEYPTPERALEAIRLSAIMGVR